MLCLDYEPTGLWTASTCNMKDQDTQIKMKPKQYDLWQYCALVHAACWCFGKRILCGYFFGFIGSHLAFGSGILLKIVFFFFYYLYFFLIFLLFIFLFNFISLKPVINKDTVPGYINKKNRLRNGRKCITNKYLFELGLGDWLILSINWICSFWRFHFWKIRIFFFKTNALIVFPYFSVTSECPRLPSWVFSLKRLLFY